MSLAELLPTVQALPRSDKLRLIHLLVDDLARDDAANLIEAGKTYEVWSPFEAYDAAEKLLQLLESQEARS